MTTKSLPTSRHDRTWYSLVQTADYFIVQYSIPPAIISVKMFLIGHAFELYLKAVYVKILNDYKEAVRKGHKLDMIWAECLANDPSLADVLEIRPHILVMDIINIGACAKLSSDDRRHLLENHEMYIVIKHLADLKYFGQVWKSHSDPHSIASWFPDDRWSDRFRSLRSYLDYPVSNCTDVLSIYISDFCGKIPESSKMFLKGIVNSSR